MINSPIYVFDSIGCKFSILNGNFIIGQSLYGYNALTQIHVGSYIPYLVRDSGQWEVGVGYITKINQDIVVERTKIIRSSNKDNMVHFNSITSSEFYVFANESNFNVGFNNVIVKNKDFVIEKVQATYLIDTTESSISATLPALADTQNLVIELKMVGGSHAVFIRDSYGHIIHKLNENITYSRLVSDGSRWIVLNSENNTSSLSAQSIEENNFGILSNPDGDSLSFQYNDAGSFSGGLFYYGSDNKLLLGSSSESMAHAIIPTSGSANTIFNSDNQNSNFIIEGSGTRNLFFDYRGRLGLNIPSGSSPDTIMHIINTTCKEGIRLENRTACHPTNMTLFYKPATTIADNTPIAEIKLSAKNTAGIQTDFATIESKALSTTAGSAKGQFNIVVATTDIAGTGVTTISTDPDATIIGYSNNNLTISNNDTTTLGYSNSKLLVNNSSVTIAAPTINFNSSNIVLGTGAITNVTVPILYSNHIQSNTIKVQNIAEGSILSINSSGYIVAGNSVRLPISENKILTTTSGGAITGIYGISDYFVTNGDVIWNQYDHRPCSIAARQILFDSGAPLEEFSIGDQIEINISGIKYYRDIIDIEISSDLVVSLLVNQNLTTNTFVNGTIQSITKGGYLSLGKKVDDPSVSDATNNILSIRPQTDTVFNTSKKDINFSIYGTDQLPALSIKANAGRSTTPSGIFHPFAAQKPQCNPCVLFYPPNADNEPFAIVVNSGGSGLSTQHVSANFNHAATGIFSGMLTTVGTNGLHSYYGTYDQNGNASEWVEDPSATSTSSSQFAAGGSWKTDLSLSIGASGLKNISPLPRMSGYEDVGFRIASQYNITDVPNITGVLELKFVSVSNPNNFADASPLYLYQDELYSAIEIPNLGSVNKNYRIGKYEVTNAQYIIFLNAVATTGGGDLYKTEMTDSDRGGIIRTGDGSSSPYEYTCKNNMADKPVVFVDYLSSIRFINWLHNGALVSGISDIDTVIDFGAYDIFPIGESSYLINKNIYQKYWMPNLNEWHKAAYFEPRSGIITEGSSTVLIKREEPYMISSGSLSTPAILANLSVSGWLYVDHLIVGDNLGSSSVIPRRTIPVDTGGGGGNTPGGGTTNEFACNVTADCNACETCSVNGFCIASTDECCVANCCLTGSWNTIEERCDFCNNCNMGPVGGELPCQILGTC